MATDSCRSAYLAGLFFLVMAWARAKWVLITTVLRRTKADAWR